MANPHRICSISGCSNPARKRGWCTKHYQRWQVNGDPERLVRKRNFCSVEGCEAPVASGGLCGKHHMRWKRHGSTDLVRAANGDLMRYLIEVALPYQGTSCLFFPYNKSSNGYGQVRYEGQLYIASRLVCQLAHGEPPDPSYDAAHNCGRGADGCVNPNHLRWATRIENLADRLAHGTDNRGEKNEQARLTQKQVQEIRALRGKMPQLKIAKLFGITQPHVCAIQTRKEWAWLDA